MNPLYLGTRERRLFGIYEPPTIKAPRPRAAVLCYPWGPEYVYAHRSMRQLAARLSQSGYHTLRFDFFGTGDSFGELAEADLAGWQRDAESAIEGIKDITGSARVALIGMRVGATVAAKVAACHGADVDALVLWDPIVSGEAYLRSLTAANSATITSGTTSEFKGFALNSRMRHDFQSIDLHADLAAAPQRSLVLVTSSHDGLVPLPKVSNDTRSVSLEFVASPCPWEEAVTMSGAVPVQAIQRIVDWLT